MDKKQLTYYKNKLIKEKKRINELIGQLKDNEMTRYNAEIASELSFYDNHPSDIATETFEVELGRALEANESSLLDKVNDALRAIEDGSYGKCRKCGKDIGEERLKVLPYAENCIQCQKVISAVKTFNSVERVVEEDVLKPFGYGFGHYKGDDIELDAEDSYRAVGRFDHREYMDQDEYKYLDEYYFEEDAYVEEVEKISNQQYKAQLPD
jgi:YteA family regulatory protein